MNTRSLRFRLLMWHAGLLSAVFILFSVATCQLLRHYLEHSLAESLLRRADQISVSLLANADKTGERYVVDEIKARYAPENYDRYIRISRGDGSILYASGRTAGFDPAGLPAENQQSNSTRITLLSDHNRLLVTLKVYQSPSGQKYLIETGAPVEPIQRTLGRLIIILLLGVPLVALVAVGGGYYLVGRALAPVVEIARSAEQITQHNLEDRLPITQTGDELEQLSLALNRMIARLSQAFEHDRRFLADASHELRTPLAALRGEMESLVEQARGLPELRDRAGSALEEVDRLAKIVDALFAISRLDAGEAQQEWAGFDLALLGASTAEQMSLLAEDKGISMACHVQESVSVKGDRARIKQVVVNLLDNAIKYTPSGGSINLEVRSCDGKAVIEVADTGIGIPAGEMSHIFERFFRVDKARSRDIEGAGLGLAIVKSICTAHGGQVNVESIEGRGSRFKVELPLARPGQGSTN
jgi:heavy metal sensor kinase